MSGFETIVLERDSGIGRIIFDRPDRLNTFTQQMFGEFCAALDALETDPDIKVIIVKGNGRGFCAGWELNPDGDNRVTRDFEADLADMDRAFDRGSLRLWRSPKATIAQIHGFCVGGGLPFAMDCDLVYAADDTRIGQPEARSMGLVPDIGLWPLTINIRRTKELLLTGDMVTGAEAAAMGMINASKPLAELELYVEWMAARIATLDTETIAIQKLALNQLADLQQLSTMVGIGKTNNLVQHKQRGRAAFAAVAAAEGVKAALEARDEPFGGTGVVQSRAWDDYRATRLGSATGAEGDS
jgi:enoyl-CoA hydratase